MGKWQELASRMGTETPPCADSADSAVRAAEAAMSAPKRTVGTGRRLPPLIVEGLERLRSMPAPRLRKQSVWGEVVADAWRLANEGWATSALALGWDTLDLWGVSPAAGGLAGMEGLAVWLAGRRPVLIDADSCIVADAPGSSARSIFYRRPADGRVLLWDLRGGAR